MLSIHDRSRRFPRNQLVKVSTKSATTEMVRKITITVSDLPKRNDKLQREVQMPGLYFQ